MGGASFLVGFCSIRILYLNEDLEFLLFVIIWLFHFWLYTSIVLWMQTMNPNITEINFMLDGCLE